MAFIINKYDIYFFEMIHTEASRLLMHVRINIDSKLQIRRQEVFNYQFVPTTHHHSRITASSLHKPIPHNQQIHLCAEETGQCLFRLADDRLVLVE